MRIIYFFIFFYIILKINCNCPEFNNNIECENGKYYNEEWDERCFQTPPKDDTLGNYKRTFQDMHLLVGYAQLKYNSEKTSCVITFITKVNPKLGRKGIDYKIIYNFGAIEQEEDNFKVNSSNSYSNGLQISAKIIDINNENNVIAKLILEDEYFIWDNLAINLDDNIYEKGQKGVIVELFGWPYDDIAEECEFLSVAGYLGIKIFPPNESILNENLYENEELNPWSYFFQPVSYKIKSRLGNKKQLKNMINRCRKNNIRIYSEVIINQMVSNGNDAYQIHQNNDCTDTFGPKNSSAGSPFWTTEGQYENNKYTEKLPTLEFPSVPYCGSDFHCYNNIDYSNYDSINYGWVGNLIDLNTEKQYVRQRIADFLTELISIGISGFSINNSKHISPINFSFIFKLLKENLGSVFPDDFLIYLEIQVGNEKNMLFCSEGDYNFGESFSKKLIEQGLTDDDINKIKIWTEGYLEKLPNCNSENDWAIDMRRHIVSLENQDDMKPESSSSYSYIYLKDIDNHRNNYIQMIKKNDINWKIKILFSSYSLINEATGFPDGKSDCGNNCQKPVPYVKAYEPLSIGYDTGNISNWIQGNYTRIHRDLQIVNAMREWMGLSEINSENLYKNEIEKVEKKIICEEKCSSCDEESNKKNLCLICNINRGFYPVNYNNPEINQTYYECFHKDSNPKRFYFDIFNDEFKPCYETCETCSEGGTPKYHNCLTCETNYILRPENSSRNNCVTDCDYSFYISKFGQYKCSDSSQCPEESKLYVKKLKKCTDDCKKENVYKYQYNGNCLDRCPDYTFNDTFLCKEITLEKCILSENEIEINSTNLIERIQTIVSGYCEEFNYTKYHISQFKSKEFNILIYKKSDCITELSLKMPKVDFGDCYNKVKNQKNISEDLIIAVVDKLNQNNPITSYSFFHPKTGEKLDAENICKDEVITVEENILSLLNENNPNYKTLLLLTSQNINIFNLSDDFYTDICYEFNSPINKDIPLRDRLLAFYPNITLCDNGCENTGINLTSMSAICKCKFNDIANNELIKDNILINSAVSEIIDIINDSNIAVLKCYKYIFKYFTRSYGGFITISLLFIQIILTIVFYNYDMKNIRKYIFDLMQNYITYLTILLNNNSKNEPPKKLKLRKKRKKSDINKITMEKNEEIDENKISSNNFYKDIKNKKIGTYIRNNSTYSKENLILSSKTKGEKGIIIFQDIKLNNNSNIRYESYFKEYLTTQIDDMDYDDAIKKDNRKFFNYFFEAIKEKQIIANTFFAVDPLRTRTIKIMLFLLNFILYLIINGFFFSEDYVSQVYNLEEEETFFSFIPRSVNRFFYTTLVSIVVGFIIDCIFVEEKKIRGIFLREKDNLMNIKYEISVFINDIKSRYFTFILIIFIILIISLYYLLCFNYVYPNMQIEWIKSSIAIMIIMQIVSILIILLETILRFISFSCQSEKIYKISKLFG